MHNAQRTFAQDGDLRQREPVPAIPRRRLLEQEQQADHEQSEPLARPVPNRWRLPNP